MSNLVAGRDGEYELVIGLETHAQVVSEAKLFSGASAAFGGEPNEHVAFLDAGMPGMLPVVNEVCVEAAVKTGIIPDPSGWLLPSSSLRSVPPGDLVVIASASKPVVAHEARSSHTADGRLERER